MNREKIALVWFRRDLRINDNTAFDAALKGNYRVLPVFIFDHNITDELEKSDPRISFIFDQLAEIDKAFKMHGSSLLCLRGEPVSVFEKLSKDLDIGAIYVNRDYEPYATDRDKKVKQFASERGIQFHEFKDQVIFEQAEIVKDDGQPYTVYTPYKNKWLKTFQETDREVITDPDLKNLHETSYQLPTLSALGFERSQIQVRAYTLEHLSNYGSIRDFPYIDKTSYLSPHLRFGTISVRQVITRALEHPVFLSELIWREFFMQILYHFPSVVHENFKSKYNGVSWRNDQLEYEMWTMGKTGYPLVDAGMRQLNQTGYMHNRVRMITAGFLCKHLLMDWRMGESYFAKKLLDYELSSNNGNWQWAAGTGCDAAPYFRIFNPQTQLLKFDKELKYVKKWIPEYGTSEYPEPMVDHKFARERALTAYKTGIKE